MTHTTFTIGALVLNTLTDAHGDFNYCGRVVEIFDNGDLLLQGHGLKEAGTRWRADAAKCSPFSSHVTETVLVHRDALAFQ